MTTTQIPIKGISPTDNATHETHGSAKRLPEMLAIEHVSQGVKVNTNPTQESLSTFEKKLEGKEDQIECCEDHLKPKCELCGVDSGWYYRKEYVLSAQSKALEAFIKDLNKVRTNSFGSASGTIMRNEAIALAQKHFGKGGK